MKLISKHETKVTHNESKIDLSSKLKIPLKVLTCALPQPNLSLIFN